MDDEQNDRELIRHILHRQRHSVLESSNYSQAIEIFQRHSGQIDLLVADVAMPERNGCELAKHLLKLQPELAILFVSGFAGAEVCKQYGIQVNALHFLSKPFLSDVLASRVGEILGSAQKSPFVGENPAGDSKSQAHR